MLFDSENKMTLLLNCLHSYLEINDSVVRTNQRSKIKFYYSYTIASLNFYYVIIIAGENERFSTYVYEKVEPEKTTVPCPHP